MRLGRGLRDSSGQGGRRLSEGVHVEADRSLAQGALIPGSGIPLAREVAGFPKEYMSRLMRIIITKRST